MTEQPTMAAALSDARAAHRTAAESADRYRDVVSQVLGLNENPGDDELVARLLAAHGMAGAPESTRWRDFLGTAKMQLGEAGIRFSSDLDPQELGVGSDQDAPSARQEPPQATEQADPVAQYPPKRLRASEAVPDDVLQAGRAAAWPGLPVEPIDYDQANRRADAATRIAWQAAHRRFSGMIAYEVTCLRCVDQLDQLAAERAAGIEEGRREAARELERRFSPYLHPSEPGRDTADDMRIRAARIASGDDTWARETDDEVEPGDPTVVTGAQLIVADGAQPDTTITAADLERGAAASSTWPGPDLAEVGKWAQDFTTDEDGAPGSVSELDEHVWEEWGRTVGARTDRDRYRQLAILAAWVVATMRELRLRVTAAREVDAPSEVGASEPTSNSDPGSVGASPALERALALLHDVLDDHWLDIPGRPAGQPGAMRFLDGGQLAGWRQRMAAIEKAAG